MADEWDETAAELHGAKKSLATRRRETAHALREAHAAGRVDGLEDGEQRCRYVAKRNEERLNDDPALDDKYRDGFLDACVVCAGSIADERALIPEPTVDSASSEALYDPLAAQISAMTPKPKEAE